MSQSTRDPRDARIERLERVVTELQEKLEKAESDAGVPRVRTPRRINYQYVNKINE